MTPDELKSMLKGQFIVMKTGAYPMKVKLKLFFQWGITFGEPYQVEDKGSPGGLSGGGGTAEGQRGGFVESISSHLRVAARKSLCVIG